jgi:glutathionyl-hydroquinone reductase
MTTRREESGNGHAGRGTRFDDDPPPDRTGRFVRPDSLFRDRVTRDGGSGFKAEPGRYQLVTAPSCPWAHRTVLVRKLKRLENAIPLLDSDLPKGQGWAYSGGFDDLRPRNGIFHVHQIYTAARSDYYQPRYRAAAVGSTDKDNRQQRIVRDHPHAECGVRRIQRRLARLVPEGPSPRHRRT